MFQLFYAYKVKEFKTYAQASYHAQDLAEGVRWVIADTKGLVISSSNYLYIYIY